MGAVTDPNATYTVHEVLSFLDGDITYRQLDYWLRKGFVWIGHEAEGTGNRRVFTLDEARDLMVLGRMVHQAKTSGFEVTGWVIKDMWAALVSGGDWTFRMSIHDGTRDG